MEGLARIRGSYINDGMSYAQAEARCAQDAMLDLIAKSTLADSITIKGGVLMQHVSKDARRATTDFDLDFVRYPIADASIRKFVDALVLNDASMRERSYSDIASRLRSVFSNRRFASQLSRAKNDWLEVSPGKATSAIVKYFSE